MTNAFQEQLLHPAVAIACARRAVADTNHVRRCIGMHKYSNVWVQGVIAMFFLKCTRQMSIRSQMYMPDDSHV